MSARAYTATSLRVLDQLRADRRTVAMIVVVPSALLALLYFVYRDQPAPPGGPSPFDRIGVSMLGILPFVAMFLVTVIAMQRERTSGTLERLMTTPITKLDLLGGYGTAFSAAAVVQAAVACAVCFGLLGLHVAGNVLLVVLVAVVVSVLGVALGLLCSAFARTEFQAVQFMPLIVGPQLFVCGLLVPRSGLPGWLEAISNVLPLSYAVSAMQQVAAHPSPTGGLWRDIAVVAGFAVAALCVAAATMRRRTP